MADQLQLRRGTTSQNLVFTGAQAEVIVDTTRNALVVHNGITPGGFYQATSAQVTNGTFYYNEDAGSAANAYILVPKANTNTPSTYQDGVQFGFVSIHPNTGPSTANFQGIGTKSLKYADSSDPLAGEISGRIYLIYDAGNDWFEIQRKASGPPPQLRTIGGSVSGSALTMTLAPCVIDFRASSLGSGVITSRSVTSTLSLVVPAGATLGTANNIAARIVLVAILGPSNVELAVINLAGGVNLDESTLINTVAITSGSNLANAFYSASARTGVPFRVVGYIDSLQTTAGTWAAVPTAVQGAGGQAIGALSSLGYGQLWQSLTGSRSLSTTFTNTTGKPIAVHLVATSTAVANIALTVNGVLLPGHSQGVAGNNMTHAAIVPPGATYSAVVTAGTPSLVNWLELR